MDSVARIIPNHLGQPYKIAFQKHILAALGVDLLDRMAAELEPGDVVRIWPDPNGPHVLRAMDQAKAQPYLSLSYLLAEPNTRAALNRTPRHVVIEPHEMRVYLRQELTEDEYRFRRFQHYQRPDPVMASDGVLDLHQAADRNIVTSVPVPAELYQQLREQAARMKMTVSTYIVHVLSVTDHAALPVPQAADWRGAGWQVRNARAEGRALTAEEMMERGIPPASDLEWLRARVAEGMSYADMARKFGGGSSLYAKWGRKAGIRRK